MEPVCAPAAVMAANAQTQRPQPDERWHRAHAALTVVERRLKLNSVGYAGLNQGTDRAELSYPQGRLWHVEGGHELLLQALSQCLQQGQWLALVDLDNLGWCRAAELGIVSERTVAINTSASALRAASNSAEAAAPGPSPQVLQALTTIIDGFDVVAVGDTVLTPGHRRSVAARIRSRRITLFTTRVWAQISSPWQSGNNYDRSRAPWKQVG